MQLTCIHQDQGLCPSCHDAYTADPAKWLYSDNVRRDADRETMEMIRFYESESLPEAIRKRRDDTLRN